MDHSQREACHIRREREREREHGFSRVVDRCPSSAALLVLEIFSFNVLYWLDNKDKLQFS